MNIFSCCYKYLLYSYHLQLVYVHGRRLVDIEIINLFLRRRIITLPFVIARAGWQPKAIFVGTLITQIILIETDLYLFCTVLKCGEGLIRSLNGFSL